MRTKVNKTGGFVFLKDEVSGLVFAGEGAYLSEDRFQVMFQPTVALTTNEEMTVEKAVRVSYIWCEHEHSLYVQEPEKILDLLKAVHPGREAIIVIDPEYYSLLMADRHQAYLDRWSSSPGQGCL